MSCGTFVSKPDTTSPPEAIMSRNQDRDPRPRPEAVRILIVDDDPDMRELSVAGLALHGFLAEGVASAEEAIARLRARRFAALVSDLHLPSPSDGAALCEQVASMDSEIKIFLLSGEANLAERVPGYAGYLRKPTPFSEIAKHLNAALHRKRDNALAR